MSQISANLSAEGVQHGPYPETADPFEQENRHHDAIENARYDDAISWQDEEALHQNIYSAELKITDAIEDRDYRNFGEAARKALEAKDTAEDEAETAAHELRMKEQDEYDAQFKENEDPYDRNEEEPDEDPLEGDIDRWVHPDETRTDEQIAHDDKYRVEPY